MKLSFVVPAHNEEALIGPCLQSILREIEGKNYETEIIVVDNASSDNTRTVAARYNGVMIVDEPHKGLPRARHAGYIASSGDLIANVDADSILPPGWVYRVFTEFSRDKKLVALSGPFVYYDLSKFTNFWVQSFFYVGYLCNLFNYYVLGCGSVLQGGNFVLRRDALQKIGGYNTALEFFGEDIDIARRIGKVGKVKFTISLPMYSSGRRLKQEGAMMTAIHASLDYIWMMVFNKPFRTHPYRK
jgi:glycosyltransferase involved in cell wall biosynthesis